MTARTRTVLAAAFLTLAVAGPSEASPGDIEHVSAIRASDEVLLDQANGIDISPDGRHVYVARLSSTTP